MEDLRLSAVAARVVAWHNRHPLARRIGVSNVHAMGYVALPFAGQALAATAGASAASASAGPAAPEGGSLRERALARARQQGAAPVLTDAIAAPTALPDIKTLSPDFSESFIETLATAKVAHFAMKAGAALPRAPVDGPVRQVRADGGHSGREAVPVYLLTAVIETGTRKTRVLLGGGLQAPVLGRRVLSSTRLGAVSALLLALVALPVWLLGVEAPEPTTATAAVPPMASASGAPLPAAAASPEQAVAGVAQADAAKPPQAPADDPVATPEPAPPGLATAPAPATTSAPAPATAVAHAALPAPDPAPPAVPVTLAAAARSAAPVAAPAAPQPAPPSAPRPAAVRSAARAGPLSVSSLTDRTFISDEAKAQARAVRQALDEARGQAAAVAPARPGAAPMVTAPPAPATSPVAASTPATAALHAAAPAPAARALTPAPTPLAPAPAQARPPSPVPAPVLVPVAALPPPSPPATAAFALSTRPLRTLAEADQVSVAMRALLKSQGSPEVKVQVLPQGEDWRVVGMPFARRADADKARALLVSRGMRIEVVGF